MKPASALAVTLAAGLLATFGVSGARADQSTFYESAASCTFDNETISDASMSLYNLDWYPGRGMTNEGIAAAPMFCPLRYRVDSTTQNVVPGPTTVFYSDTNGSTTSGQVTCAVIAVTGSAAVYVGATRYSCATSGGCSAGGNSYQGFNSLQVDGIPLFGLNAIYMMKCTVPLPGTTGYRSGISSYYTSFTY